MIEMTSDIDQSTRDVMGFFREQVPFGFSRALNTVAFEIRRDTVERVYPRDFEMRNRALPRRLFGVTKKATKSDLHAEVGQTLALDWVERQATGGTKVPRGNSIAIAPNPNAVRTGSGAIKKAFKPRNLKGAFKTSTAIMVRDSEGDLHKAYTLKQSVRIPKRFTFYEEADLKASTIFPTALDDAMDYAIRTSRFFPA